MALVLKDRVRETSTTTGTGAVTLAGAVTGFQSFAAIGNANTTYYTIYLQGSNEWEVGIGTYTASGTTLSRDTVLASSNSGNLINFSAGTKDVFCTYPAGRSVYYDTATNTTLNTLSATTVDTTNIEVTNVKAKDGTAAIVLTDSTGAVTVSTALTANGGAVFNENGANVDFRVEGDTDANLIFADASADAVGIGTSSPAAKLHVVSNNAIRMNNAASTSQADLYFADSGATLKLENFFGTGSVLSFGTNSNGSGVVERARISSDGTFRVKGNGTAGSTDAVQFSGSAPASAMTLFTSGALWIGSASEITGGQAFLGLNGASGAGAGPALGFAQNGTFLGGVGQQSRITGSGTSQDILFQAQATSNNVLLNSVNGYLSFQTGNNERARITSTGTLNIIGAGTAGSTQAVSFSGTAPVDSLVVTGSSGNVGVGVPPSAWGNGFRVIDFLWNHTIGADSSASFLTRNGFYNGSNWIYKADGYANHYATTSTGKFEWYTAGSGSANGTISFGSAKMVLDNSGNLGLGVTPSAWSSSNKAIQISGGGVLASGTSLDIAVNAYKNVSGNWTYLANSPSTIYTQYNGNHYWSYAGASTGTISYTTAMTLDAAGTLLINNTARAGYGGTVPKQEIYGASVAGTDPDGGNLVVYGLTNTASAGGAIALGSLFTTGSYATFARVRSVKDNSNSGEYGGGMAFDTRANGGNMTERMRLDSSGNLGLGVTPSAWGTGSKALQIGSAFGLRSTTSSGYEMYGNAYNNGTNEIYIGNNYATKYQTYNGQHLWFTAPSGTAGNTISFTQAMTLDASGNLLVGTTSRSVNYGHELVVEGTAGEPEGFFVVKGNRTADGNLGAFKFFNGSNSMGGVSGVRSGANNSSAITFATSSSGSETERARITSGGYFKASNSGTYVGSTGTYHELVSNDADDSVVVVESTSASYTSAALFIGAARNTTNNTFYAIQYYNRGATATKFLVADSGDVTNTNGTYGTISDQKMKTDIVDAGSQWADIKALRFRKFKMINDPDQRVQLGVVAQEVEQTSPGLVDEHIDRDAEGNDLGTTTKSVKTSVLLMKAAVALQEAMTRIETLEAEVAALKGN